MEVYGSPTSFSHIRRATSTRPQVLRLLSFSMFIPPFLLLLYHFPIKKARPTSVDLTFSVPLHVGVFLNFCYTFLVREFAIFLDVNRTEGNPGRIGPAAGFHAHSAQIDLFDFLPRHDPGKLHPTVLRVQQSAEWQIEILQRKLVIIRAVVHLNTPNPGLFAHIPSF